MDGRILVYVAGNPSAYPLEYYDSEAERYQGVIPRLLEQFSAWNPQYEIVYYSPGEKDQRQELARNLQVDLLSGYREGDTIPECREQVTLFTTADESGETSYCICLTDTAPDGLAESMQTFFQQLSQETVSGLLMEVGSIPHTVPTPYLTAGSFFLGAVIMASVLGLTIRHYRRRLRSISASQELDPDTGLGNRNFLLRTYREQITDYTRPLYHLVYFYINADCLHVTVNSQDICGIFRYCAEVIQERCSSKDFAARVSEHGLVLLYAANHVRDIESWLPAALAKIRSYPAGPSKYLPGIAAACIYSLNRSDRNLENILFQAGQAAQQALRSSDGYLIVSRTEQQKFQLEQKLRDSLERALQGQEFQLYIQFYVDAQTHSIVGAEALSRWNHPDYGLLMPGTFVPLLEQDRLISKLDYHCLRDACDFLEELNRHNIRNFFLSCNFSRETFSAEDFAQRCQEIIAPYHFPRELLIFELTESTTAPRLSAIRKNMLTLKEFGVRIALDDFGEGFTSFSDLQQYPVNGIKLDKGLIDHIHTENGSAILRAMVQVGHELGITILAEGVETAQQAAALRDIHCDVIQGFCFYAPLPREDALQKILQHFKTPPPPRQ